MSDGDGATVSDSSFVVWLGLEVSWLAAAGGAENSGVASESKQTPVFRSRKGKGERVMTMHDERKH